MEPSLTDLIIWARQAGAILESGFGQQHQIRHKGRVDLVTEMDRRSEDFLVNAIRSKFPDHTIFTEESGHLAGKTDHCWYIDPLDGTTNYAHNMPIFSVSIAYASAGQMRFGVVFDPIRNECFNAERGKGARLNDRPLHVSEITEPIDSLMVTGFPYDINNAANNNIENFLRFMKRTQSVRRLGSAALDLCYVATGRLDGYWEIQLNAWDIAAGGLMIEEAGGCVTTLNNEPDYLKPPYALVAANPTLHAKMLDILNASC
jgi:myo-inositol-1(or 4)-monophosphatase